jgi:hypothetical protein
MRMHPVRIALLLLAGLCLAGSARAAEIVIYEVKGTHDWSRGQVITTDTDLDVPAGAELRAVRTSGKRVVVRGPFRGRLALSPDAPEKSGLLAALVAPLVRAREAVTSALIRSAGLPAAEAPWVVDLTTGGAKCVRPGELPRLWQPAPEARTSVVLVAEGGNESRRRRERVSWPQGAELVPWPEQVPRVEGESYLVEVPALRITRTFTLAVAPAELEPGLPAAVWMMSRQCDAQALRLLSDLPVEASFGAP